jgi:hypothetical protein
VVNEEFTIGPSPSGKALGFDPSIPRFDNFVGNKIERASARPRRGEAQGGAE